MGPQRKHVGDSVMSPTRPSLAFKYNVLGILCLAPSYEPA